MNKTVYLGLGSNVGNRSANLTRAIAGLAAAGVQLVRRSSLYATEPVDSGPQNWFLNCVVEASTDLTPRQLLRSAQQVERRLGRRRAARNAPRIADIDILLYGSNVVRLAGLEIPHPRIAERRFVLVPLREIAPAVRHPALKRTIAELLAQTSDRCAVRPWRASSGGTERAAGGAVAAGQNALKESR